MIPITIKELILRENEIESLAENSFQRMNKLERLDMGTNKLKAINETMFSRDLRELKEIDLSHNEITVFNMDIVSNEDNQGISMKFFKKCFFSINKQIFFNFKQGRVLSNLEKLNLSENNLSELKANKFRSLHNLKHLDLSSSKIASIEMKAFFGLDKLDELNLRENQIAKLEESLFHELVNLKNLDVSENKIANFFHKITENNRSKPNIR